MIGQVGNKSFAKNWVMKVSITLFVVGLIAMFYFGKA